MSTFNFVVVGSLASSHNAFKCQCNTTAGTITLITTYGLGIITTIRNACNDQWGNYYIAEPTTSAIASSYSYVRICKYTPSLTLDTTWGTSGYAYITALVMNAGYRHMTSNEYGEIAVLGGNTAVNVNVFTSAGVTSWKIAATVSVVAIPVAVNWLPNRNVLVAFGAGSAAPIKEYDYSNGTTTKIYDSMVSVDYRYGTVCGPSGNIFVGGRGSTYQCQIYSFVANNSIPTWSTLIKGQYITDALYHSNGYLYAVGETSATPSSNEYGKIHKINPANASVLAQSYVSCYGSLKGICEAPEGSIIVYDQLLTVRVYSANLTVVAETSTIFDAAISKVLVSTFPSWVKQTPRVTTYKRQLTAMANDQVWYENPTGTMAELTSARGSISTSKDIGIANFAQKLYVVNENNFQVVDFCSSRISTAALGTAPLKDLKLTGGTSGAIMYVDFCDSIASTAAAIWGYRTTFNKFQSGDIVTGGASNSISFTLAADETQAPTIHTWTTYGASTVFGVMPGSATLLARYAGRLVMNDVSNPHRWIMTRVFDPYNFLFTLNDPLSAIRSGNADAGEVGDIIVAIIPFRDEYCLFGCVSSFWLLRGNPASGGSLEQLSDTVGILGPKAWCFDDANILYFLSQSGLYRLSVLGGVSAPENISSDRLPKWLEDWAYDETKDVITLTFDPFKRGILICKTTKDTGANTSYWYDLQTDGFYPEQYPAAGGIYSSLAFDAQDPDYRKVIYGCANGYIGTFSDSNKSDTIGGSTVAVESYLVTPIIQLSPNLDLTSKIEAMRFITAGGRISGAQADTDSITLKCYMADSAEATLEDILDGATALLSASITAIGRNIPLRTKLRGNYFGMKVSNSVVDSSWTLEKIQATHKLVGGR